MKETYRKLLHIFTVLCLLQQSGICTEFGTADEVIRKSS